MAGARRRFAPDPSRTTTRTPASMSSWPTAPNRCPSPDGSSIGAPRPKGPRRGATPPSPLQSAPPGCSRPWSARWARDDHRLRDGADCASRAEGQAGQPPPASPSGPPAGAPHRAVVGPQAGAGLLFQPLGDHARDRGHLVAGRRSSSGVIDNIEGFIETLLVLDNFKFNGRRIVPGLHGGRLAHGVGRDGLHRAGHRFVQLDQRPHRGRAGHGDPRGDCPPGPERSL